MQDGSQIIEEHFFPIKIIENVTARWKDENGNVKQSIGVTAGI